MTIPTDDDLPTLKRKRKLSMLRKNIRDRRYRKRSSCERKVVLVEVCERRIGNLVAGGLLTESMSEDRSLIAQAIEVLLDHATPIRIAK